MAEEEAGFVPSSILAALNRRLVAYVLIGGVAARAHGTLLRTGDVDVCPQRSETNAERLADALTDLDARVYVDDDTPALALPFDAAFVQGQDVLNLVTRFGRLDILWEPAGTRGYEDLAAGARTATIRDVPVPVADLDSLIRTKEATGRPKDLEWLEQLRFIRHRNRKG